MAWEYKQGTGIWQEWTNSETGESSISDITPKVTNTFCKQNNHYFETVSPSSRDLVCKKCGQGSYYVLGLQSLKDGKVINNDIPTA